MKTIQLSQNKVALISDEDYERVNKHKWYASFNGGVWYARTHPSRKITHKHKTIHMHRFIMNLHGFNKDKRVVDHIDGNGLNNQRENLRVCTQQQNLMNRREAHSNTGFIGVYHKKELTVNPYQAKIRHNGKRIHIGYYSTPEEAAKARDEKSKELFGEYARLNFPNINPILQKGNYTLWPLHRIY